ncbi:MAG: sigma-54 dependent transcriptional regulator [Pseudomonadota bacterium]|nr:sigma-54 dependent transcriptional regulator [Pseudomonadota bacterium]
MLTRLGAANYEVQSVDGARTAIAACRRFEPNLVITRLRLQQGDGMSLLKELKRRWPMLSVIILTAHGTIPEAVHATHCGAFGFLVRPIEKSELLGQVQRAIAVSNFSQIKGDWRANIVSRSRLMEDRLGQANSAARTDAPVLLSGESGTGKELFARAIHAASARRAGPFSNVVCGPGADHDHVMGAFEAARGGTLLIQDIGDLSLKVQARLASVLRELESSRANNRGAPGTDVRLICTTSGNLKNLLESGRFHQELYYQINVLSIEVPPLGRRREDIPLLISRFLEEATDESGVARIYSPKAVELLATTDWPGNVRQLFDFVKQNVALSQNRVISEEFVKQSLGDNVTRVPSYDEAREEFSRAYLIKNLQSTGGNMSRSARLAKRNRTDFYKLLARYRLMSGDFKNAGAGDDALSAATFGQSPKDFEQG